MTPSLCLRPVLLLHNRPISPQYVDRNRSCYHDTIITLARTSCVILTETSQYFQLKIQLAIVKAA